MKTIKNYTQCSFFSAHSANVCLYMYIVIIEVEKDSMQCVIITDFFHRNFSTHFHRNQSINFTKIFQFRTQKLNCISCLCETYGTSIWRAIVFFFDAIKRWQTMRLIKIERCFMIFLIFYSFSSWKKLGLCNLPFNAVSIRILSRLLSKNSNKNGGHWLENCWNFVFSENILYLIFCSNEKTIF